MEEKSVFPHSNWRSGSDLIERSHDDSIGQRERSDEDSNEGIPNFSVGTSDEGSASQEQEIYLQGDDSKAKTKQLCEKDLKDHEKLLAQIEKGFVLQTLYKTHPLYAKDHTWDNVSDLRREVWNLEEDLWEEYNEFYRFENPHPSRFFSGYSFLLTGLHSKENCVRYREKSRRKIRYDLHQALTLLIQAFGGKVVKKLSDFKVVKNSEELLLCIAPIHSTSFRYLCALAAGVPCLHYSFILHCLEFLSFFAPERYYLPYGNLTNFESTTNIICAESLIYPTLKEKKETFYPHSKRRLFQHPKSEHNLEPLDGLRIQVEGFKLFIEQNTEILRVGGAEIKFDRLGDEKVAMAVEAVLCDNAPDKEMVRQLNEWGIPMFNASWLRDCLISRKFLFPHADGIYTYTTPLPLVANYRTLAPFYPEGTKHICVKGCKCRTMTKSRTNLYYTLGLDELEMDGKKEGPHNKRKRASY